MLYLTFFFLQIVVGNRWRWQLTLNKSYIVNGIFQLLTATKSNTRLDL